MTDEDAFFEVWFQMQRRDHWKSLCPNEPFPEEWGNGFKGVMRKAWMGRASLHVVSAGNRGEER
jgi:hypothetical protein